jgi:hypothetical protein
MRIPLSLIILTLIFALSASFAHPVSSMQRNIKPDITQQHKHTHDCDHDHHDHETGHDQPGHECEHGHNHHECDHASQDHECDHGHHHGANHRHNHHNHDLSEFMTDCHVDHGAGFFGLVTGVFKHAITVTVFVLVMMLLIEYISVRSRGAWNRFFTRRNWVQILIAAVLGFIPGCLGVYVAVSLYAHKLLSFAGLVTAMIATSGDEAFVMIGALGWATSLKIFGILAAVGIITGFAIHLFMKNRSLMPAGDAHFQVHQDPACATFDASQFLPQLKRIAFERALLIFGSIAFIVLLLTGDLGIVDWHGSKPTFLIVSLIALAMFVTVPDHFLQKHLWGHVIRKHFLKIFLWTFGAFLFIHIILPYLDLDSWLQTNMIFVLIIAVLIGIIPESGPHIVFIVLFLDGNIPLSILVANSIVQDGHGALPLLAESRRSFVAMKAINLLIGLIVGLTGYFWGW